MICWERLKRKVDKITKLAIDLKWAINLKLVIDLKLAIVLICLGIINLFLAGWDLFVRSFFVYWGFLWVGLFFVSFISFCVSFCFCGCFRSKSLQFSFPVPVPFSVAPFSFFLHEPGVQWDGATWTSAGTWGSRHLPSKSYVFSVPSFAHLTSKLRV